MTHQYSKLTRAVPTPKPAVPHVVVVVLKNWIIWNGIPNTSTTSNGLQFVSKSFAALCKAIEMKLITTTKY